MAICKFHVSLFIFLIGLLPLNFAAANAECSYFLPYLSDSIKDQAPINCEEGLDNDGDGIRDWKIAKGGHTRGKIKYVENDLDWDNDNIENVLDPDPWSPNHTAGQGSIPEHLQLSTKGSELNLLQLQLLEDCNILAINYTDKHYQFLLNALLLNCSKFSFLKHLERPLKLYSFKGLSLSSKVAVFHPDINALSLGGVHFRNLKEFSTLEILKIFSHELGHLFIFEFLKPKLLQLAAVKYGKWDISQSSIDSYYHKELLTSYPKKEVNNSSFKSSYAKKNIHEWFCEYFMESTFVPQKLALLNQSPKFFNSTWIDKFFQ